MNKFNPNISFDISNISYNYSTDVIDPRRLKELLNEFTIKINELVDYTMMMEKYYDLYVYSKPCLYGGFREWINTSDFHRLSHNWQMCKTDLFIAGIDDISIYIDFLNRKQVSHSISTLEEYKFKKIITKLLD